MTSTKHTYETADPSETSEAPATDNAVIELRGITLLGQAPDLDTLAPQEALDELVIADDEPAPGKWVCSCTRVPVEDGEDGDGDDE